MKKKRCIGQLISLKYTDRKKSIEGVVIDYNDDWTLMKYNPADYIIDGYIILKHKNIDGMRRDVKEKFKEKVIKLKGLAPTKKEKIPLTDLRTILEYLSEHFGVFQFYTKSESACYLGRIKSLDSKQLVIDYLNTEGKWDGQMTFRPNDIRVIEYDTDYINSLKLITRAKKEMTTHPYPSTWVLLDDRAGNRTQALGVAGRLGWPVVEKEVRYTMFAALPNAVLRDKLWHVTDATRQALAAPYPALVISAGRRTAPVALSIRKASPETRLVHCMWPDIFPQLFDLILAPEHDKHKREGKNMFYTLGAPHGMTHTRLYEESKRWHPRVSRLPHPHIALVVGGSARGGKYTLDDFKTLAAYASAEAERLGGSLLITSSPRTGAEGCEAIKRLLTVPHIFHQWQAGGENPYVRRQPVITDAGEP